MVGYRTSMGGCVSLLLVGLATLHGGAGAADPFVTAGGRQVALPAMEFLTCAEMRQVLRAIDETGYRGFGPEPIDPADSQLFDYENRLSGLYYETCVHGAVRQGRPPDAFARGYALTQ